MPKARLTKGQIAENYAEAILKEKGCVILDRNYHGKLGEVDILIEKDGVWAIEVKFGKPTTDPFITAQVGRIISTTQYWLTQTKYTTDDFRGVIGCKVMGDLSKSRKLKYEFSRLI